MTWKVLEWLNLFIICGSLWRTTRSWYDRLETWKVAESMIRSRNMCLFVPHVNANAFKVITRELKHNAAERCELRVPSWPGFLMMMMMPGYKTELVGNRRNARVHAEGNITGAFVSCYYTILLHLLNFHQSEVICVLLDGAADVNFYENSEWVNNVYFYLLCEAIFYSERCLRFCARFAPLERGVVGYYECRWWGRSGWIAKRHIAWEQ